MKEIFWPLSISMLEKYLTIALWDICACLWIHRQVYIHCIHTFVIHFYHMKNVTSLWWHLTCEHCSCLIFRLVDGLLCKQQGEMKPWRLGLELVSQVESNCFVELDSC